MDDGLLDLKGDLQKDNVQLYQQFVNNYSQFNINQFIIQQSLSGVNTYE